LADYDLECDRESYVSLLSCLFILYVIFTLTLQDYFLLMGFDYGYALILKLEYVEMLPLRMVIDLKRKFLHLLKKFIQCLIYYDF